jgi:RHS repeat-associated protein
VPIGLPGGDTDSTGATDTTDVNRVQTWINTPTYDVRGDIDLDGDVDATDKSTIRNNFAGTSLGRGRLSMLSVGNRKGFGGYDYIKVIGPRYDARRRLLASDLGRWTRREPLVYIDGPNLYTYVVDQPIRLLDPLGLSTVGVGVPQNVEDKGGNPPPPLIPGCPSTPPKNTKGSKWCKDTTYPHKGADSCYRSFGTGTIGGQQCCYDKQGKLIRKTAAAGNVDRVGPANGKKADGTCTWGNMRWLGHLIVDYVDAKLGGEDSYEANQQRMRDDGVPTGTEGGGKYSEGISDDDFEKEFHKGDPPLNQTLEHVGPNF